MRNSRIDGTVIAALVVLVCTLVAPSAAPATEIKRTYRELPVGEAGLIEIQAAAATVLLEPYNGTVVEATMVVSCGGELYGCRELGQRVTLVSDTQGGTLRVQLAGPLNVVEPGPVLATVFAQSLQICRSRRRGFGRRGGRREHPHRLAADLSLRYPYDQRLSISLGEGHLILRDPRSATELAVDEGSISIYLREDRPRSVKLRASGGGQACLLDPSGRTLEAGRRVDWEPARGPVDLSATIGKGDLAVRLLP